MPSSTVMPGTGANTAVVTGAECAAHTHIHIITMIGVTLHIYILTRKTLVKFVPISPGGRELADIKMCLPEVDEIVL